MIMYILQVVYIFCTASKEGKGVCKFGQLCFSGLKERLVIQFLLASKKIFLFPLIFLSFLRKNMLSSGFEINRLECPRSTSKNTSFRQYCFLSKIFALSARYKGGSRDKLKHTLLKRKHELVRPDRLFNA